MAKIMARKVIISDGNREENAFFTVADDAVEAKLAELADCNADNPFRSVHGSDYFYYASQVL